MGEYYSRYSEDFKKEVAEYAAKHGYRAAAEKFGVSTYSAWCWLRFNALEPRRPGAPEGNLNALGGRILNTQRHT